MPISLRTPIRRFSQNEFSELSFEVMRHVFAIHNELGRFFDERIYQQELAHRMPNVRLEEPVDVTFDSFHKRYFLDALVADGAVFEFKAVEAFTGWHRAQLIHYLMLCELGHGKLINVRPAKIEHEFVNTNLRHADRTAFGLETSRWNNNLPGAGQLRDGLLAFLADVGTGLAIALYEEVVTHFFGGPARVEADVAVLLNGRRIGHQRVRLIAPGVAVKITCLDRKQVGFEEHARRLLNHLDLHAIAWVNIHVKQVTFTTLER